MSSIKNFITLIPDCPKCNIKLEGIKEKQFICPKLSCGYIRFVCETSCGELILRVEDRKNKNYYTWHEQSNHITVSPSKYYYEEGNEPNINNININEIIEIIKEPDKFKKYLLLK